MGSQGAIFKLVLRDERFDRLFTASDYLRQRLDAARAARAAAGEREVQPTFADIERSHLLFVRATYRPYVAVASEYARVKPAGDGGTSLGPAGGTLEFTFPAYGHFTSDMALHLRFRAAGDPAATAPGPGAPLLRYCALPGVRALRRVALRSEQVLIDDYTPDDVVARSKFFVHADQRGGWERCVGQQEAREATFLANGYTSSVVYRDGPQTPKLYQPAFDLIVPLEFWFCRDPAHALLNDLVPNTQRTVTVDLAPLSDLVQALQPDPDRPTLLVAAPLPFARLGFEASLYVNGLYVNPEIHDIFASRVGFSLVRVHRRQTNSLQNASDAFLLDQLKFPAEYLMVGFRSRALAADFDRWWMMGTLRARPPEAALVAPVALWNAGLGMYQLTARAGVEASTLETFIEALGVTAHGIELYPMLPALFYNAYLPTRYASTTMVTSPLDTSAFLVNFCLYPGRHNPSGSYNLSAGRELYLKYALRADAADIGNGNAEMVVSMSALNFLVRRGDKLALRYQL